MDQGGARSPLLRLEERFLRPYRPWLVAGMVGLLLQSLLVLPIPLMQGWVVDQLLEVVQRPEGSSPSSLVELKRVVWIAFSAMAACHLGRMVLGWIVSARIGRIAQEVVVSLRSALQSKLMSLPMSYFDRQQTGRLMARVTSDVGAILMFINSGSLQLVNDLLLAIGIAVVLFWLQWQIAMAALIVVPFYAVNHRYFAKKIHQLSLEIRGQIASLYALLSERVSAVRVVRSFAKEEAELEALDAKIDRHRELAITNIVTNAKLGAFATLISGAGTVFVLIYGGYLVGRGGITIGDLLACHALIAQLYGPIVRLSQFQATAIATRVSVERLFEIFDEPESIEEGQAKPLEVENRGELKLERVSFAYKGSERPVLSDLSIELRSGQTLGVLGPSGAGKSTLLALIPRIYDLPPENGTIWVDGVDVRELTLSELHRRVILVPQQAMLFEGTIRSNLLYARPDATEDQIQRVLADADFSATVDTMPDGLETPVGERGLSLSGGQRQRLALARALLAEPDILLLDDCTSALDAETEARIQDRLAAHRPTQTRVIVSHKVSSVRRADRIVVLDAGRILEAGTHDELIEGDGYYARLHEQQLGALTGVD